MTRVLALLTKDLRLFAADRKALVITFLVPIFIASFFGMIFGGSGGGDAKSKKIAVLVVDEDRSPLVEQIVASLATDSIADPKPATREEADRKVKAGESAAAVIFPKGFGKAAPQAMFSGETPVVELRFDPSKNLEVQAVQGSIMQVAMQAVQKAAFSGNADYAPQIESIDASGRYTSEQKARYREMFASIERVNAFQTTDASGTGGGRMRQPFALKAVPQTASADPDADKNAQLAHTFAGMAVQGVLFFGINAAMALLSDRRKGIWRRLRAAPVGLSELLAGKALSSAAIGFLVLAGVLAFGMAVFGIRVAGSWLGLGLVLAATALMTAGFGLLVASLGRTEEQSRGLSILAVLTMSMLGGAWFPASMMPAWVQRLSFAVPSRWALDGLDAMLWRGQGLVGALAPIGGLLAFTLVFVAVAAFRFKTMPETA